MIRKVFERLESIVEKEENIGIKLAHLPFPLIFSEALHYLLVKVYGKCDTDLTIFE